MTTVEKIRIALNAGELPRSIADRFGISLRRVYQVRGVAKPREPMDAVKSSAIRAALQTGMSRREAARQFGVSRKIVELISADLDLSSPSNAHAFSAADVAHVLSRHAAGRSIGTIAREIGRDCGAIRGIISRHAVGKIDPKDTIMAAIAAEMARRGMTAHGLAEAIGQNRERIYECLRGVATPSTREASRMLDALDLAIVAASHARG